MSYACGPADWIDLAIGRLEDAKRSLRECDRLRQGCDICEELRQARRCLNKALIMVAEEKEIVKEWSEKTPTSRTSSTAHSAERSFSCTRSMRKRRRI